MIDILSAMAIVGVCVSSWALVHLISQAYSKAVYNKWLSHPLAEKTALLEALLEAKENEIKSKDIKLANQDAQMQELFSQLTKKLQGG